MICIYDKKENKHEVLNSNGIHLLDDICIFAEIKEVLNGTYELEAEFKFDDNEKYKEILEERILKVEDVYGEQVFRMSKTWKTQNSVRIFARQNFYDTNDLFLEDVRPESKDGNMALDWIFKGTTTPHEFNYISNISTVNTAYYVRKTVLDALMNLDNAFMKRWGGELDRSIPYLVRIDDKIGSDRGVEIRSKKNLLGFEEELDIDSVITRVYPIGADGFTIDEKYVDSDLINNYATVKSIEVEFKDVKVKNEEDENSEGLTEVEAKLKLKEEVQKLFNEKHIDQIKAKYLVDFVDLSETEEYKQFQMLEKVWLGDTVSVYVDELDISIQVRVIERVYDVLAKRHKEIKLSNYNESHKSEIDKVIDKIEDIITDKDNWLEDAKQNATDLINNGLKNSHVLVRKNEILIMDTDDPNTAVKVWRFNQGGLGYSSTGYNGEYGLAMTMDGSIVADFITVGKLKGSVIDARNLTVTRTDGTKTLEVDSFGNVNLKPSVFTLAIECETNVPTKSEVSDAVGVANSYTNTQIGIVNGKITETVSQTDYNKNNEIVNSKFSLVNQTVEGISTEVSNKVGADEVKSVIEQNPTSVNIGFNGINNNISIDSKKMAFKYSNGKQAMTLKGGSLYTYNYIDNSFLGGIAPRVTANNLYKGVGFIGSKHCQSFSIDYANAWDNDTESDPTGLTPQLQVNFVDRDNQALKGIHSYLPMYLSSFLSMAGNNIIGAGEVGANKLMCQDLYSNGITPHKYLTYNAGVNATYTGNDIHLNGFNMLGGGYSSIYGINRVGTVGINVDNLYSNDGTVRYLAYNNSWGHVDLIRDLEVNYKTIKNGKLYNMATVYSLGTGATTLNETISTEEMMRQESFSTYNENDNSLEVNINEVIKTLYERNKVLEKENEILKNNQIEQDEMMILNAYNIALIKLP